MQTRLWWLLRQMNGLPTALGLKKLNFRRSSKTAATIGLKVKENCALYWLELHQEECKV
jgi:hypothetical protein